MEFGQVPGLTTPVSRIVQGTIMLRVDAIDQGYALLDAAFEAGYNTFDTAHGYGGGDCERVLGRWIKDRDIRDKVVILTKGAHHNADRRRVTPFDITADLHDSLARLGTDYVDLYLLHRDDPAVPVGPIVDVLNEHFEAGRIRVFGGSNWSHVRLAEANAYAAARGVKPFGASSPNFSLAEQVEEPWDNCISIAGPSQSEARAWYLDNKMPVFAWSSLAGGFFSGRFTRASMDAMPDDCPDIPVRCYRSEDNLKRLDRVHELAAKKGVSVPQVAVAYVLHHPMDTYALVAPVNSAEIRDTAAAASLVLTDEEMAWLDLREEA